MSTERSLSTLLRQLVWSNLRIALPAALVLCAVALAIYGLSGRLDRMQHENIPSVEATHLLQLGLQRSSAAVRGWVALKQPEQKVALETAWSSEIDPALATLMAHDHMRTPLAKRAKHKRIEVKLTRLRDLHDWIVDVSAKPGNEPARLVLSTEFAPSKDRLFERFSETGVATADGVGELDLLRLRIAIAELDASLGGFVVEAHDSALHRVNEALLQINALVSKRIAEIRSSANGSRESASVAALRDELKLIHRLSDSIVASRRSPRSNVAWNTIRTHAQPLADEIAVDLSRLSEDETRAMEKNASEIVSTTNTVAVFSMLAFFVIGTLVILLARKEALRVSTPITRLSRAAESVGRGEFSTALPQSKTSEVHRLIKSFERMRDAIAESYSSLHDMAYTDHLTGLANRKAFNDLLVGVSDRNEQHEQSCSAIALIDLDHFKQINDSVGHDAGDHILVVIASRLRSCMRNSDMAARLGGDEFALILRDVAGEEEAGHIAERLLSVASEPITFRGEVIHPSATIGLVLVADSGCDSEELLKRADISLYEAKELNRGTFKLYSEVTHQKVRRSRALMEIVANQPPEEVFEVHYQPVVSLKTGAMVGVEALLRWRHPQYEVDSILEVINLMERHGHMMRVSTWILQTALTDLRRSHDSGDVALSMSVNISADLLHNPEFVTMIQSALAMGELSAKHLILEVTETMVSDEFEVSLAAMYRLSKLGVQFALDDFGTGYSSLMRLKEMPLARLKIDREFVSDMLNDPNDAAIVEASIQLGRTIGMSVVAEGIETAEQAARLEALGCGFGQGYYFGRPVAEINRVHNDVLRQLG